VVDRRRMPAVNLQFQIALLLVDGRLSFDSGHEETRMSEPHIAELSQRIHIDARPEQAFIDNSRQAIVTATLRDGRVLRHHTLHVRGTPADPMTQAEVEDKARDLMTPVLGDGCAILVRRLCELDQVGGVRELRPLLGKREPS
jgi:2-methylcitrate dehydratase PrpD